MIQVINTGRRSGKTLELIKLSAENGGYIVCQDSKEADRIIKIAIESGFDIPYPLTYAEIFGKRYYTKEIKKLYIDNADYMLQQLVNDVELKAITISGLQELN